MRGIMSPTTSESSEFLNRGYASSGLHNVQITSDYRNVGNGVYLLQERASKSLGRSRA